MSNLLWVFFLSFSHCVSAIRILLCSVISMSQDYYTWWFNNCIIFKPCGGGNIKCLSDCINCRFSEHSFCSQLKALWLVLPNGLQMQGVEFLSQWKDKSNNENYSFSLPLCWWLLGYVWRWESYHGRLLVLQEWHKEGLRERLPGLTGSITKRLALVL